MSMSSLVSLGMYNADRYCGYCGNEDTSRTYAFTAAMLSPETYEAMLNRGWRRYQGQMSNLTIGVEGTCISLIYGIRAVNCILYTHRK
jgi:arginyl-tRNA--protein-N-Asp/Glu arginylyltransferase